MARSFASGSSQYLEYDSAVVTEVPISVSLWAYLTSSGSNQALWGVANSGSSEELFDILLIPDTIYVISRSTAHGAQNAGISGFTYSAWHHVVAVIASTTSRIIYLDGTASTEGTDLCVPSGINRTSIARIGDATPGGYVNGLISMVSVWQGILDQDAVDRLYVGCDPRLIQPHELVGLWPLRGGDNDVIGGLNLTPYNSPTWGASDHPWSSFGSRTHAVGHYTSSWRRRIMEV